MNYKAYKSEIVKFLFINLLKSSWSFYVSRFILGLLRGEIIRINGAAMSSILVCSKDEKLQHLISATYHPAHQIIICSDSESCLDIFYSTITEKSADIKMCILDIDGQENIIDIIEDFNLNHPQIRIIVAGRAIGAEIAQEAVRHGADGYLVKPIDKETLESLI